MYVTVSLISSSVVGKSQEYFTSTRGDRAEVVRRQDNLKLAEGEFAGCASCSVLAGEEVLGGSLKI